jgi:bifunctional enzyme CysN/CysC
MDLLRFSTAGSVDDGKSTLIGRLLYDSKGIFEDQLAAIERTSRRRGYTQVDLALLTDGLRAEREQGITIDVAYRYFATPRRKFIIADTPGHVQYTRNMVTGASTADLAIILVDARNGVLEQSRRHAFIAALLGIPHLVVAVNKMDLVGYSGPPSWTSTTSSSSRSRRSTATTSSSGRCRCPGTRVRPCSTCSSTCTSGRTATSSTPGSPCSG